MVFKNSNDIAKYYQKLINQGKISELKSLNKSGGDSLMNIALVSEEQLLETANALKDYLKTHISRYFESYKSSGIIPRTGQLLDSIQVNIENINGKLQAHITFDSTKIMRDSIFPEGEQGDVLLLLDKGWEVKKDVWFKDIEHFGYFDGAGFIASAIKDAEGDERFANIRIELSEELM
jgi:hypothetical protein